MPTGLKNKKIILACSILLFVLYFVFILYLIASNRLLSFVIHPFFLLFLMTPLLAGTLSVFADAKNVLPILFFVNSYAVLVMRRVSGIFGHCRGYCRREWGASFFLDPGAVPKYAYYISFISIAIGFFLLILNSSYSIYLEKNKLNPKNRPYNIAFFAAFLVQFILDLIVISL